MNEEPDREMQRALREWERQDPPPAPPVEAMWEAVRPSLPLSAEGEVHAAPAASVARTGIGRRFRRSGRLAWIPTALAAGLAGLLLGRITAPGGPETTGDPGPGTDGAAPTVVMDVFGEETPGQVPQGTEGPGGEGTGAPDGEAAAGTLPPGAPQDRAGTIAMTPGNPSGEATEAPPLQEEGGTGDPTGPIPVVQAPPGDPTWSGTTSDEAWGALNLAATRHLLEVGPMLTRLAGGADPEEGTVPPEIRDWARRLLDETRMILDTPAPLELEVVALLEDLEMILTQVATIPTPSPEAVRLELEIIAEGMSDRRILPRIRMLAEAGP